MTTQILLKGTVIVTVTVNRRHQKVLFSQGDGLIESLILIESFGLIESKFNQYQLLIF